MRDADSGMELAKMSHFFQMLFLVHRKLRLLAWGCLLRIRIVLCGGACGTGCRADGWVVFKHPPHAGISIGTDLMIGKNVVWDVPLGARLLVGHRVKLNMDIVVAVSSQISIGDDCLIGEFVSIRDADHGIALIDQVISAQPLLTEPVAIGRNVWIGRGAAVLRGAVLEEGCVVAANAVVRAGAYERNSIIGGVPGRVLRLRS